MFISQLTCYSWPLGISDYFQYIFFLLKHFLFYLPAKIQSKKIPSECMTLGSNLNLIIN